MLYNLTGKVTQGGTVALDPTLSLVNAAAQAKATGEAVKALNDGIEAHTNNKENPHGVTKAQLGLGNVDDTADKDKPVSTKQEAAIELAVATAKNEMEVSVGHAQYTAEIAQATADEAKAAVKTLEGKIGVADGSITTAKFASGAVAPKATQLATSRNITVKDSSCTYSGDAAGFNGTAAITLKMPATGRFDKLILGSGAIGTSLPSNPTEGQVFLQIEG